MQLTIISGASSGIGAEMARQADVAGHTVATISRSPGPGEHKSADLSNPGSWPQVIEWMDALVQSRPWSKVVFIHNAGTIDPVGFAGEVEPVAYSKNVLLNSASPQVLGAAFVASANAIGCEAMLMLISSGAGKHPYTGWSSYCAGKAAADMWVRAVGTEQAARGSKVSVISVAPGVVDTPMQANIRSQPEESFPQVERFQGLHKHGHLLDAKDVAAKLLEVASMAPTENGAVMDIRELMEN